MGAYPWLPLIEQTGKVTIGEKIGVFGYPLGQELGREITYTEGVVGSVRHTSEVRLIQISADVTRDWSVPREESTRRICKRKESGSICIVSLTQQDNSRLPRRPKFHGSSRNPALW